MTYRLEVALNEDLRDAEGEGVRTKALDYFGIDAKDIRVIRVLTIDADLGDSQREAVRTSLFTNPVIEHSSFSPLAVTFDWLIWIGFRPGVRDTAGSTAVEAIEDLLNIRFSPGGERLHLQALRDSGGPAPQSCRDHCP